MPSNLLYGLVKDLVQETTSEISHAALYCMFCLTFLSTIMPYNDMARPTAAVATTKIIIFSPFFYFSKESNNFRARVKDAACFCISAHTSPTELIRLRTFLMVYFCDDIPF